MAKFAKDRWNKDEVLSLFDPVISEWFSSKYSSLTEPQEKAVPLIHEGKNVLVSSPTGSGKTLTAFISVINELFLMAKHGSLEDRIYCVYISPLKALANDIHRNLEVPLQEIKNIAEREGVRIPDIRVAVRSGDTSTSERQKMLRKPPHIFITTPESLALVLTAPKFREKFRNVKYVIVDEIHEVASNKRGVLLSLNLERLAYLAGEFQRIGLSATQAPIEEIAKFLGGFKDGKERDVWIVQSLHRKELDLKVITPVEDLTMVPYEVATEKMYDMLVDMIKKHRTTLIFTNTRSGTEHVAYKLKERGVEGIEAHHGSLSKETRLRVESALKNGELKCVISSTSLELGIDIGYIDLVVQIGSPKSVAKGLQRIGRSGHAYGKVAKGRFMVFELDDLVECTTLVKCAYDGKIDRIFIPENSLDVLAQTIVGMSLEQRWKVSDAYSLIKNSYCYRNLPMEKFLEVLRYLSGKVMGNEIYSKIWFDEEEGTFGRKRSSRMIYFMNMGTIPDESDYLVVDIEGKRLGDLSEKFVEKLQKGDVFVLGARSYEVLRITHSKVVVRDALGKRPTVPSWAGEMLPRSYDLSIEVGKFRQFVETSVRENGEGRTIEILMKEYYLDYNGARSIVSYIKEQMAYMVPTHIRVVVEGYVGNDGKYSVIFHYPFGRRVNDALSRAYAHVLTERFGINVGISITDDAFMLTIKKKVPLNAIRDILNSDTIDDVLRHAIFGTELFKQRFRHVATRSFMVLRKYKGRSVSVARQQLRSDRILKLLSEIPGFPVIEETFNEIFTIAMDLPHAKEVLKGIENGDIEFMKIEYSDTPSVFAHSIILVGISDIVLMEDRTALLKHLHLRLLERIIPAEETEFLFSEEEIESYFSSKIRIRDESSLMNFLSHAPGADVLHRRGINIYDYSEMNEEDLVSLVESKIDAGEIVSVYAGRLLWTTISLYPVFSTLYAKECDNTIKWEGDKTVEELAKEFEIKKSEIMDILKCMERAYLVGRKVIKGKIKWYVRNREEINRDYALEILIKNLLNLRAPLTFEEIVYTLHIDENDARRILKYMVNEGTVKKAKFVVGYGEQYMLEEDYRKLREKRGISEARIQSYRAWKIIRKMSCREYFDNFLIAFSIDSIKIRGCFEEFLNMVRRREIAYGKFLGGRYGYARKRDVPLFAGVYRIENIGERERKIIELIARLGTKATLNEIIKSSSYRQSTVKRIIDTLEKNVYVYRTVVDVEDSSTYYFEPLITEMAGDAGDFTMRIIRGYGPMTKEQFEWLTRFPLSETENLKELIAEGRVYYTAENIGDYEHVKAVVPSADPFAYPIMQELYDKFSNLYSHVLVEKGQVVASGELIDKFDHYFVEEVVGDKKSFMDHLSNLGMVISNDSYGSTKFKKIGDYYASGVPVNKVYDNKKILSYVLWKSRVVPGRKLKTPLDVAKFLMFLHSDFELIRAYKRINISKYYHSELVYETLDLRNEHGYATKESAAIFQAIKSMEMDKDMHVIYTMLLTHKKMKISEIFEESPLGIERTEEALKNLYMGNYIVKYPLGYVVVEKKYEREYALEKYIENLFDVLGFINSDIAKIFGGNYLSRADVVEILKRSELKAGLYLNDGKLYYGNPDEIDNTNYFNNPVVLHPSDPISRLIMYIYPQKFEGYVVINGEFLGVVKATGKRKLKIKKSSSEDAEKIFKEVIK